MKQRVIATIASTAAVIQLFSCLCQVQGGIITNQQSLTSLPSEIADAQTTAATAVDLSKGEDGKNSTRSGRVTYTAPYSNVRIASKMDKALKFFPSTAVSKRPQSAAVHVPIGPVLRLSSTSTTTTPSTTSTSTTTTTTSTTTTTTPEPIPSSSSTTSEQPVEETIPEIVEIMEETEPTEVATEAVETSSGKEEEVTEQSRNYRIA